MAGSFGCGGSSGPNEIAELQGGPVKLAGIGDSIMEGVDVTTLFATQREYSFAQGTDPSVNSVYSRYKAMGYLSQDKTFVSISGSEMHGGLGNAPDQARRLCDQVIKPDRIIMLLGGNDICNRSSVAQLYPVADFRLSIKEALDTLGAPTCGLPKGSWVHVLSMPRVDLLQGAGLAKADPQRCKNIWAWGVCTVATQGSASDLATIGNRIDEYNQALAEEVSAADATYGGLAGVRFTTDWQGPRSTHPDTSVGSSIFSPNDVSDADCFHPSIQGQRKLACLAWETWEFGSRNLAACAQ